MRRQAAHYSKRFDIADYLFGAIRAQSGRRLFLGLFGGIALGLSAISLWGVGHNLTSYVDLIDAAFIADTGADGSTHIFGSVGKLFLIWTVFIFGYSVIVARVRTLIFRDYIFTDVEQGAGSSLTAGKAWLTLSYVGFYVLLMLGLTGVMIVAIIPLVLIIPFVSIITPAGDESFATTTLAMFLIYIGIVAFFIRFGLRLSTARALTALTRQADVFTGLGIEGGTS